MKTVITVVLVFAGYLAMAQAPQKFSYQGVARDNASNILANQNIGLQISLHSASPSGTVVYQETQAPTTNAFGLFNIQVGGGTVVSGDLASVDWGANSYYLQVEMDATGGTSYLDMGTAQLLSVPYALYAANSGTPGPQGPAGADGAAGPQGPTGPLVAGVSGQTLRHDGTDWVANSALYNDGNNVGIGNTSPQGKLDIQGEGSGTVLLRFNTDRPWSFIENGSGTLTDLQLQPEMNSKNFEIISQDGSHKLAVFRALNAGSTVALVPDGIGKVGIGTSSPSEELHVEGAIRMVDGNQQIGYIPVSDADGKMVWTDPLSVGVIGPTGPQGATGPLVSGAEGQTLRHNGTDWVANSVLFNNGNRVGIGANAPNQKLQIHDGDGTWLQLTNTGSGTGASDGVIIGLSSSNEARIQVRDDWPLVFQTNDVERMRIANDGNVGVGSNAPTQKLDIDGNIRMRSGASAGFLPVSSSDGTMTWTDPSDVIVGGIEASHDVETDGGSAILDGWSSVTDVGPKTQGPGTYLVIASFRCRISGGSGDSDDLNFRIRAYSGSCNSVDSETTGTIGNIDSPRGEYFLMSFHRVINLTESCQYDMELRVNLDGMNDTFEYDDIHITALKVSL